MRGSPLERGTPVWASGFSVAAMICGTALDTTRFPAENRGRGKGHVGQK
jgi:hypothetical protein